jgi:hypothetical protein
MLNLPPSGRKSSEILRSSTDSVWSAARNLDGGLRDTAAMMLDRLAAQLAASAPRCGVPKKTMPFVWLWMSAKSG